MADSPRGQVVLQIMKAVFAGPTDSRELAAKVGVEHQDLVGRLRSLESGEWVTMQQVTGEEKEVLTAEAEDYIAHGSPGIRLATLLKEGAQMEAALREKLGAVFEDAVKKAQAQKLINQCYQCTDGKFYESKEFVAAYGGTPEVAKEAMKKAPKQFVLKPDAKLEDGLVVVLRKVQAGEALSKDEAKKVKPLVKKQKITKYVLGKGKACPAALPESGPYPWERKLTTDMTEDMLRELMSGDMAEIPKLKPLNLNAKGKKADGGNRHPLMKLRQEYREIFIELGFQEMETNRFVDSTFWNFDTLFVPQKHPARDMQDTFFVSDPKTCTEHPPDYFKRCGQVHCDGYEYDWRPEEAEKLVLRTHTTAISSYTLYNIAQKYRETGVLDTGAYFSIDRVFRNEEMDKTHLCEFHQIEGFVIDYGLSLGNMMSLLRQFFEKAGVPQLRFKPTYNPYTEPSMEVHGWHEGLGKYIEVGNSGVFRPEMLEPMGLPKNVTVIAWGLGLERPAMMFYKRQSIHEVFGHRVDLKFVKQAAIPKV